MDKFYQHIEKLLSQHDYVVVPNLGGFVLQMQSAKILSDRITPPHATIGFNILMNHSDGLLAIEISRIEQISYRKAVEYIDSKVEFIQVQLNSNGSIIIGNLGILQKNSLGSLTFNPIYKSNFLPLNIGLTDLYIVTKKSQTINENRKVIVYIPSKGLLKYAVAAIIILGMFLVSPHVSDIHQTDYANLASLSFVNSYESTTAKSFEKEDVEIKKVESVKPTKIQNKEVNEIQEVDIVNKYHVIVASLPSHTSAQKFCNELIKEKFKKAHVLPFSKTYRIAIQSFSDHEKALEYMENLRNSDYRFETAWVFSK